MNFNDFNRSVLKYTDYIRTNKIAVRPVRVTNHPVAANTRSIYSGVQLDALAQAAAAAAGVPLVNAQVFNDPSIVPPAAPANIDRTALEDASNEQAMVLIALRNFILSNPTQFLIAPVAPRHTYGINPEAADVMRALNELDNAQIAAAEVAFAQFKAGAVPAGIRAASIAELRNDLHLDTAPDTNADVNHNYTGTNGRRIRIVLDRAMAATARPDALVPADEMNRDDVRNLLKRYSDPITGEIMDAPVRVKNHPHGGHNLRRFYDDEVLKELAKKAHEERAAAPGGLAGADAPADEVFRCPLTNAELDRTALEDASPETELALIACRNLIMSNADLFLDPPLAAGGDYRIGREAHAIMNALQALPNPNLIAAEARFAAFRVTANHPAILAPSRAAYTAYRAQGAVNLDAIADAVALVRPNFVVSKDGVNPVGPGNRALRISEALGNLDVLSMTELRDGFHMIHAPATVVAAVAAGAGVPEVLGHDFTGNNDLQMLGALNDAIAARRPVPPMMDFAKLKLAVNAYTDSVEHAVCPDNVRVLNHPRNGLPNFRRAYSRRTLNRILAADGRIVCPETRANLTRDRLGNIADETLMAMIACRDFISNNPAACVEINDNRDNYNTDIATLVVDYLNEIGAAEIARGEGLLAAFKAGAAAQVNAAAALKEARNAGVVNLDAIITRIRNHVNAGAAEVEQINPVLPLGDGNRKLAAVLGTDILGVAMLRDTYHVVHTPIAPAGTNGAALQALLAPALAAAILVPIPPLPPVVVAPAAPPLLPADLVRPVLFRGRPVVPAAAQYRKAIEIKGRQSGAY